MTEQELRVEMGKPGWSIAALHFSLFLTGGLGLGSLYILILYSDDLMEEGILEAFPMGYFLLVVLGLGGTVLYFGYLLWRVAIARWRKLQVFISYKHLFKEEAKWFQEALREQGIKAEFLPFAPDTHDSILFNVQRLMRRSQAVLVLPDAQESSFVDAEIFGASLTGMPLAIIRHHPEQRLPNTAFSGYPVFELDTLRQESVRPLADYFRWTTGHLSGLRQDLNRIYWIMAVKLYLLKEKGWTKGLFRLGNLAVIGLMVYYFFGNPGMAMILGLNLLALAVALSLLGMLVGFWYAIRQRKAVMGIARQSILSGAGTPDRIREALTGLESDQAILKSISREGLDIRH